MIGQSTPSARLLIDRVQRAKILLDVALADFEMAESTLGPGHASTWHYREALTQARTAWDRLRAEFGGAVLERELVQSPVAVIRLRDENRRPHRIRLITIQGRTYGVEPIPGSEAAPGLWRFQRLNPRLEFGPYYAARLADGTTQCDCAEWAYREDSPADIPCKHIFALLHLGWLAADDRRMGNLTS
ncbi:hypothetical protein TA3x_002908 [Tundrisphaera sp. TA3]|uniref:hypothetical protein n=1 Tax=Tundrisphaera sp. TA3 TaxID=3435775 RepID=UPI003EBA2B24